MSAARSEDFEKGTVIQCGDDNGADAERAVYGPRRAAEQALIDAGYMTLIYAPSLLGVLPRWCLQLEPGNGGADRYNAWAPRWLVYSYAVAPGIVTELLLQADKQARPLEAKLEWIKGRVLESELLP